MKGLGLGLGLYMRVIGVVVVLDLVNIFCKAVYDYHEMKC